MIVFLSLCYFLLSQGFELYLKWPTSACSKRVIRFYWSIALYWLVDDIYASLCFVRERWEDFMGHGDFVLYHNKEKNFEVGDI